MSERYPHGRCEAHERVGGLAIRCKNPLHRTNTTGRCNTHRVRTVRHKIPTYRGVHHEC